MRSDFEKAFKKEYPHADYLACLKFDEVENQYKPINEEVEPPDVNFWVCVGVNTGWWAWQYRQTEVDELQKKNAWLSDVAERENKRANKLQEEKVSTTSLLGKTIREKNELQKRVDFTLKVVQSMRNEVKHGHLSDDESQTLSGYANDLEQALKGEHA